MWSILCQAKTKDVQFVFAQDQDDMSRVRDYEQIRGHPIECSQVSLSVQTILSMTRE